MRRSVFPAVLIVLAACSGGTPTTSSPPPPPPGSTVAVLAVQAGDGQQAEPGAALTIKPLVVAKDASGQGVAGVVVSFSVDSGGGTIDASTATTASDGTAGPGNWKLGSDEGRNVLRATTGTLAAVKLVATAVIAPVTIPAQSVGPSGGIITISQPGSPINGMTLNIAAGSFTGTQTIGVSYSSANAVPHPAGTTVISPLISFHASDGSYAKSPMLVTIPAAVPSGTFPVIVVRSATGSEEVMTTADYGATSVTGITSHLNGANLMKNDGSFGSLRAGLRDPSSDITAVVIAVPVGMLEGDLDTGFRPGIDTWEFPPTATVISPQIDLGIVGTEAWYYVARKALDGPLFKRFQEADGVLGSDRRGLRWTSVETRDVYRDAIAAMVNTVAHLTGSSPAKFTVNSWNSVRYALLQNPGRPQMAYMSGPSGVVGIVVYRSVAKQLFAADPGDPTRSVTLDFTGGNLFPVTLAGLASPFPDFAAPGISLIVPTSLVASQWPAVVDGTIGGSEFPVYLPRIGWGKNAGEWAALASPAYLLDEAHLMTIWVDCPSCGGFPRPAVLPPDGDPQVASIDAWSRRLSTDPWTLSGTAFGATLGLAGPGTRLYGFVLSLHDQTSSDPAATAWLDWYTFTGKRLDATLTPSAIQFPLSGGSTDFTFAVTGAPTNLQYEWIWGDPGSGAPVSSIGYFPTTPFPDGGPTTVTSIMRDKVTKQPYAIAQSHITPAQRPIWVLDELTPIGAPSTQSQACFPSEQIAAHPNDAAIVVLPEGQLTTGGSGAELEVAKTPGAGITIPTRIPTPDLLRTYIGLAGSTGFVNTGTLTSGDISGNAGGCAAGVVNVLSATKSGLTMQGTISVTVPTNGNQVLGSWHFSATLQP